MRTEWARRNARTGRNETQTRGRRQTQPQTQARPATHRAQSEGVYSCVLCVFRDMCSGDTPLWCSEVLTNRNGNHCYLTSCQFRTLCGFLVDSSRAGDSYLVYFGLVWRSIQNQNKPSASRLIPRWQLKTHILTHIILVFTAPLFGVSLLFSHVLTSHFELSISWNLTLTGDP